MVGELDAASVFRPDETAWDYGSARPLARLDIIHEDDGA
jgi:hypothetical protein